MFTASQIQAFARLPEPLLTVYLNTQPEAPSHHSLRPSGLTWLRKEAKLMAESLPAKERALFQKQLGRIEVLLRDRHPHERSLAIFAGAKTWEVVPLHVGVVNDLRWGRPAVSQLLWLVDEHKPYCVVVVDRAGMRVFRYQLRELALLEEKKFDVDISQWKKKDLGHVMSEKIRKTRGSQRDTFDHRMEAQYARLCREAASQATTLCNKQNVAGLFLVGADHLIGPMAAAIPQGLAYRVVPIKEDLGGIAGVELQQHLEPKIQDWERQHETALVEALFGAEHGAITEVDEVLAQLQKAKIRTLVLAQELNFELRQCTKCGLIDRSADPVCSACGATRNEVTLRDVLPELLGKYAVDVEIVSGEAGKRLQQAGGLGGWLRQAKRASVS